jgi:hypothetical protein
MSRWEYKILKVDPGGDEVLGIQLNNLGAAGWELVAVSVQFTSHFVWLKRRIDKEPQP